MNEEILKSLKDRLAASGSHLSDELKRLRTGRAHPAMLEGLIVEVYGAEMPIKAVASVSVPDPQTLQISPYDPNNLKSVSNAISENQSLGLTPSDDGKVVRVKLPPMTEETRLQMVKIVKTKEEESMVSARTARHEAVKKVEVAKKSKDIGSDEAFHIEKEIESLLIDHKNKLESLSEQKIKEITTL